MYGKINISDYDKIDEGIYFKDNFYEFELPTLNFLGNNLPISGGGYFRFLPNFLSNFLITNYIKTHRSFIMYLHPFELVEDEINIAGLSLKDRFRFYIGRKNNLNNLKKLFDSLSLLGCNFNTIKSQILKYESK